MTTKPRWEDITEEECSYFLNNYTFGGVNLHGDTVIKNDKTNSIIYDSISDSDTPFAIKTLYLYKDCILLGFKGIGDVL